jgi:hypothetical protein
MLTTAKERNERLTEWIAQRKRADYRFNVAPRYSCGSPAMVSEGIAMHVAANEQSAYGYILAGSQGDKGEEEALRDGLGGIVTAMREQPRGKGWDILDLLTGERTLKAFDK